MRLLTRGLVDDFEAREQRPLRQDGRGLPAELHRERAEEEQGVMTEIVETLSRESRDGADEEYLIPIRLDDYVFTDWKPKREDVAQTIRDRVIADFRGADVDDAKFNRELCKLLKALRKPSAAGASGASGP